jgi:hypothetical protein
LATIIITYAQNPIKRGKNTSVGQGSSITIPANSQVGDVAVIGTYSYSSVQGSPVPTPTGWTALPQVGNTATFYKVLNASDPGASVSLTNSCTGSVIDVYGNVGIPVSQQSFYAGGLSSSVPSIPIKAGATPLYIWAVATSGPSMGNVYGATGWVNDAANGGFYKDYFYAWSGPTSTIDTNLPAGSIQTGESSSGGTVVVIMLPAVPPVTQNAYILGANAGADVLTTSMLLGANAGADVALLWTP